VAIKRLLGLDLGAAPDMPRKMVFLLKKSRVEHLLAMLDKSEKSEKERVEHVLAAHNEPETAWLDTIYRRIANLFVREQ
jgi:hypothetical protein